MGDLEGSRQPPGWHSVDDDDAVYLLSVQPGAEAALAPLDVFILQGSGHRGTLKTRVCAERKHAAECSEALEVSAEAARQGTFADDTWHMYVLTISDDAEARVYVDGSLLRSARVPIPTLHEAVLGGRHDLEPRNFFHGLLSQATRESVPPHICRTRARAAALSPLSLGER